MELHEFKDDVYEPRMKSLEESLKAYCEETKKHNDKMDKIMFGNGTEGWDTKIIRHEAVIGNIKKFLWMGASAIVGILTWMVRGAL